MKRTIVSLLLGGVLSACVVVGGTQTGRATVVFDDHFTGNSGGMPAGWSAAIGPGTAVESGTTVTLNGVIIIVSDSTVNPNAGTVTLTLDVAGTNALVNRLGAGLVDLSFAHLLLVQFTPSDNALIVEVSGDGGDVWQSYVATHLTGYAFGSLRLTLVLGATTFSIASDSPPFSSGPLDYATVFPGFGRADLSAECHLAIAQSTDSGNLASASIDRLTVNIGPPVPVEGATFGQVKALYRR